MTAPLQEEPDAKPRGQDDEHRGRHEVQHHEHEEVPVQKTRIGTRDHEQRHQRYDSERDGKEDLAVGLGNSGSIRLHGDTTDGEIGMLTQSEVRSQSAAPSWSGRGSRPRSSRNLRRAE